MWNRIVSGERKKSRFDQTPEVRSGGRGTSLSLSDGGVPASAPLKAAPSSAPAPRLGDWALGRWRWGTRLPRTLPPGHRSPGRLPGPSGIRVDVGTKLNLRERVLTGRGQAYPCPANRGMPSSDS